MSVSFNIAYISLRKAKCSTPTLSLNLSFLSLVTRKPLNLCCNKEKVHLHMFVFSYPPSLSSLNILDFRDFNVNSNENLNDSIISIYIRQIYNPIYINTHAFQKKRILMHNTKKNVSK